ncbi:MAG TPA: MFS transporter, partial [Candidatus Syntrophosphaera thermopropionivorans]|nr:MFS transporter [Candidatus Syntrophosphaera thermopropionivorans]
MISRTYRVSIKEGIFAQIYGNLANIGSSFITKFMVLLGATPMQFSILSSLGQVSAVFQPLGVALTHRLKKRKKVCIWVTGIGRFL